MEKDKGKILWVDCTKGIGIILVVMAHVISGINNNIFKQEDSIYFYIYNVISSFHMPLFFIISGFLYKHTQRKKIQYIEFVKKKLISLGIPYLTFNLIYFVCGLFTNDDKYNFKNLIWILVKPISHFWFIYALLIIFLIMPILENMCKQNLKVLLGVELIICYFFIPVSDGIVYQILYYSIFFVMGGIICEKKTVLMDCNKKTLIACFLMFLLSYWLNKKYVNYWIGNVIVGLLGSLLVIIMSYICFDSILGLQKFFSKLGGATMSIYICHSLFVAAGRKVLISIGVANPIVLFVSGMFLGISLPYILDVISQKNIIVKMLFYPYQAYLDLWREKNA